MRQLFVLIALFCLPLSAMAEDRPLRILSHDRPPFHFKDESGKVVGINVDIAAAIFSEMDIEFEIVDSSWARVWHQIERGKGEAAFSTSRKKPREAYLYYPETDMWRSEFVFFVHKDNKMLAPNGSYEEVVKSGRGVGIWRGASYSPEFWQHFPSKDGSTAYNPKMALSGMYNKQLQVSTAPINLFKMVKAKRVTFCIEDRTVGLYLMRIHNIGDSVVAYENPVFSKGYPMPFVKKSTYPNLKQISEEFESRLIALKEDGRYAAIFNKWLKGN